MSVVGGVAAMLSRVKYAAMSAVVVDQVVSRLFEKIMGRKMAFAVRSLVGVATFLTYGAAVWYFSSSITEEVPLLREKFFEKFKQQAEKDPKVLEETSKGLNVIQMAIGRGISLDNIKWLDSKKPELARELANKEYNTLQFAVLRGSLPVVQFFYLKQPGWMSQMTPQQGNALHMAAARGDVEIFEWLYQQIPEGDRNDWMAEDSPQNVNVLHEFIEAPNPIPILEWAKQQKLNLLITNQEAGSLLHVAIGESEVRAVKWLCQNFPELLKIRHQKYPDRDIVAHAEAQIGFWNGSSSPKQAEKKAASEEIKVFLINQLPNTVSG